MWMLMPVNTRDTRHVFGDENPEDSEEEDYFEANAGVIFIRGAEGELITKEGVRHITAVCTKGPWPGREAFEQSWCILLKEKSEGEEKVKKWSRGALLIPIASTLLSSEQTVHPTRLNPVLK